ncbi:MAG TPA: carbohydrate kinase family protein [Thermoguttaceae bacterium]|nr:carbohydrate kinase family protein [Thermoguttaceae bacterium]
MEIDCLCAGILFADVVCSPVDRAPDEGELVAPDRIQLCLGGCASNTALDLARCGVRVGATGCVGKDVFGRFIMDELVHGGVQIDGIHQLEGIHTACTMVINVKDQDRRFIASPGANTRFAVEHMPPDWVSQAKVLYIGGYLMLLALETGRMVELLRAARAAGTKTVLDVVGIGGEDCFDRVALMLPEVDFFMPNDDEAAALTGLGDPVAQAQRFRDAGAQTVVITRGNEGSLLIGDGLRLRAGVYPTQFVGGTGSGDAFDAGFIVGLLRGEDPAGCLRWGSALGASCVRSVAATESVFDREEAEAFMREHPLRIEAS